MASTNKFDIGISFLEKKVAIDFCNPLTLHDRVLVVQEKKFYVNSMHLSMYSEYFCGLFNSNFQEKDQKEIELKEVEPDAFEVFLMVLQPFSIAISKDNLPDLINLSNMFLTPIIWQKCIEFLEDPDNLSYFEPEDLLEWIKYSSSMNLKKEVENRCVTLFKDEEVQRFVDLAADYKLERLKDHMIKHLCDGQFMINDIARFIFSNNFEKFKVLPYHFRRQSRGYNQIDAMYTFLKLLKYDLTKLADWFIDNFGRLMYEPIPMDYVRTLMGMMKYVSKDHKLKMIDILQKCSEALKRKNTSSCDLKGLNNFLPDFACLLYKDEPKTVLDSAYNLIKEFPGELHRIDLKASLDTTVLSNSSCYFDFIELTVETGLVKTKKSMQDRLSRITKEQLVNEVKLLESIKKSPVVDSFVRNALSKNPEEESILAFLSE